MPNWITEYSQRIGGWVVVVVVFVLMLVASYTFWVVPTNKVAPIHELVTTRVEPEVLRAGDDGFLSFEIKTSSIRREACPTNIYRTFTRADTGEVVYSMMSVGGRIPATGKPIEIPVEIKIDAKRMPPGEYGYTAFAINNCGEGRVYLASTEVAKFRVEAR